MKLAWRGRSLSIYGRTFLLMLAALFVAEAVGLAFVVYQPAGPQGGVRWTTARATTRRVR